MSQSTSLQTKVKKLLQNIRTAIDNVDYVNAIYWIFGVSPSDVPGQVKAYDKLLEEYNIFSNMNQVIRKAKKQGKSPTVLNLEERLEAYKEIVRITEKNKNMWKDGPIKVLCSENRLKEIAIQVKDKGFIGMSKTELEKLNGVKSLFLTLR